MKIESDEFTERTLEPRCPLGPGGSVSTEFMVLGLGSQRHESLHATNRHEVLFVT